MTRLGIWFCFVIGTLIYQTAMYALAIPAKQHDINRFTEGLDAIFWVGFGLLLSRWFQTPHPKGNNT